MNALSRGFLAVAQALLGAFLLAPLVACTFEGGEGEPCKCDNCGILSGTFYCDPGLICNTGVLMGRYMCERPMSVPQGGACVAFSSDLCATGLACSYTLAASAPWTCEPAAPPLQSGDPCPNGLGCPANLVCLKGAGGPVCSAADAGPDAVSSGDEAGVEGGDGQ
jgi:hypothetical protein